MHPLCHSSWRWRQIKKRLFIAHLSLFVRKLHCAVCCGGWKIRVTNDVSVVIISAGLVALWSTLSTLDWSPECLNNYFNAMLVFVFDSLWREAPLKPSVCSTKRFLISPKKQKMHALLRFLQIWSCGKICHNYPGGVTPICFPGHSMWFAVRHIWSKYFEKDLRTAYFHSTQKNIGIWSQSCYVTICTAGVAEASESEIWLFCGPPLLSSLQRRHYPVENCLKCPPPKSLSAQ